MINIQIIAIGSIKEKYLKEGISEYQKRLIPYAKIDVIEIKEEKLPEAPSPAEIRNALVAEAKRIRDKLPDDAYTIALAIEGETISSEMFSLLIADIQNYHRGKVVFIIGGSYGLADEIKQLAQKQLSFSRATFSHQLMRLIFFEQLYRAFMIMRGKKYHK